MQILAQDRKAIVIPDVVEVKRVAVKFARGPLPTFYNYRIVGSAGAGVEIILGVYDTEEQAKEIIERIFFVMSMGCQTYGMPANNPKNNEEEES